MTVHTQTDSLTLTVDGVDVTCQTVKGSELQWDGPGAGAITLTECATDPEVTEPGDYQPGSWSGEMYIDSTTAGAHRKLVAHKQAGSEFAVTIVKWSGDQRESITAQATVARLSEPGRPNRGGYARARVELRLTGMSVAWGTP